MSYLHLWTIKTVTRELVYLPRLARDHQRMFALRGYCMKAGLKLLLLVVALSNTLASLKPADYALHGLDALGADTDDRMYSGLVRNCLFNHLELSRAV